MAASVQEWGSTSADQSFIASPTTLIQWTDYSSVDARSRLTNREVSPTTPSTRTTAQPPPRAAKPKQRTSKFRQVLTHWQGGSQVKRGAECCATSWGAGQRRGCGSQGGRGTCRWGLVQEALLRLRSRTCTSCTRFFHQKRRTVFMAFRGHPSGAGVTSYDDFAPVASHERGSILPAAGSRRT